MGVSNKKKIEKKLNETIYKDYNNNTKLQLLGWGILKNDINILLFDFDEIDKQLFCDYMEKLLLIKVNRVNLSCLLTKYFGKNEKIISEIISENSDKGQILFLETEQWLDKERVAEPNSRWSNLEARYLLQLGDNITGTYIVSVSSKNVIEAAFIRRFTYVFDLQ